MRRVVVGTAGHIDHGKTALVAALTGIDCDRWAEEKERGITIDLGFAHLVSGDLQIGFVDVPGHERFVHNALAGLGGIDLMILVVAADEGVEPQTREHLAICSLLQIPAGLAVLTKSDLVSEDLLELAQLELAEELQNTPFAGVPIVTVSSQTGEGIPELERQLVELAGSIERDTTHSGRPVRLPIDRAFHLKGMGAIVTGTLTSGTIAAGDSLMLLPAESRVRVRSVQVHGGERERAVAGERTSLQLGGVELAELGRGMTLAEPGAFAVSSSLLVQFELLADAPKSLRGFVPIRFHLAAAEVLGRLRPLRPAVLEPGESGLAEIRLESATVAVRGDRFIARRPSPQNTLGGGVVLDPRWRRPRGAALERGLEALSRNTTEALCFWTERAGEGGLELQEMAPRLGWRSEEVRGELDGLVREQRLLRAPAAAGHEERWIVPAAYRRIHERAEQVLQDYFRRDRLARGIPKAEAIRRILPGRAAELASTYLAWLEKQKVLSVEGDLVNLPGRTSELTSVESDLATSILRGFEEGGLAPPSPDALCAELRAKPQVFDGVLRYLTERGRLLRLPNGLVVAKSAVDGLVQELYASGWKRFSVGQFKDRFSLTRKWAIPLLEYLDGLRITARAGDERELLPRRPETPS